MPRFSATCPKLHRQHLLATLFHQCGLTIASCFLVGTTVQALVAGPGSAADTSQVVNILASRLLKNLFVEFWSQLTRPRHGVQQHVHAQKSIFESQKGKEI